MFKKKKPILFGISVHSDEFPRITDRKLRTEVMIKVFKRRVKESRLLLDLKEKSYYEKPSTIKRRKRNLAKTRRNT